MTNGLKFLLAVCYYLCLTFEVLPLVENVFILKPLVHPSLTHCYLEAVFLKVLKSNVDFRW